MVAKGRIVIERQARATPILRGAKITTFLLGVLLATVLASALLTRPTSAESFLSQATCRLETLLHIYCKTAPTPPAAQPTTAPTPGSGSTQPSGTTPTTTTNKATGDPIPSTLIPVAIPDQQLPDVTPIGSQANSGPIVPKSVVGYNLPAIGDDSGVLGATDQSPLRTSPVGWVIFGTVWYWWLVVIGVVVALAALTIRNLKKISRLQHYS